MRVEKNPKAFAYRIYSQFTQQCSSDFHFLLSNMKEDINEEFEQFYIEVEVWSHLNGINSLLAPQLLENFLFTFL